jgi:hypothetical protein
MWFTHPAGKGFDLNLVKPQSQKFCPKCNPGLVSVWVENINAVDYAIAYLSAKAPLPVEL